jgi:hypothetical protein
VQLGVDLNFGGMCACSLVARVVDRHPHHDNTNDIQEAVCVLPGGTDHSPLGPFTLKAHPATPSYSDLVARFGFAAVPTLVCVVSVVVAMFTGTIGPFNRDSTNTLPQSLTFMVRRHTHVLSFFS